MTIFRLGEAWRGGLSLETSDLDRFSPVGPTFARKACDGVRVGTRSGIGESDIAQPNARSTGLSILLKRIDRPGSSMRGRLSAFQDLLGGFVDLEHVKEFH